MTLRGFVEWFVNFGIEAWRNMFPQFRIAYDFGSHVFQETLTREYEALPDDVKNDPKVKAQYEDMKRLLPKSEDGIIGNAQKLADETGKWLTETYMNITPATPDTAMDAALKILSLDTAKDITIGMAGLASEVVSAGQVETATDFFKYVRTKTGYGGAMTMLMKSPIELGVIRPLSYQLHKNFRTTYINSQTAMRLFTKELIDETAMRNAFAYEGYNEALTDAMIKDQWRELRLGELAWSFNDSTVDDAWLEKRLQYATYAPEDRARIMKMLKDKFLKTYRDRVANQARNEYKEGYISYEKFSDIIKALGFGEAVRNLLASEADYLFHIDYYADLRATWMTAYKNDVINENVYRGNLKTIMVDDVRVEAEINKAKASRKPTSVGVPAAAQQGIKVSSKPSNAMIILDDQDTGRLTPDTLSISPGTHTLLISAPGYEDAGFEIEVQPGKFVEVYAPLEKILEGA